ncbi:radical SAM protein [Chloroflexi bacterium CFX6]|nr:radical SAM protein [Chloroflexi bacterium CFX6]
MRWMMSLSFNSLKTGVQSLLTLPFQKTLQSRETLDSRPGLYHYTRENGHEKSRIHLRLDPDGNGTLIVNANSIMHLNPTAAFMAWMILEGRSDAEITKAVSRKWKVESGQLADDLSTFHFQLEELLRPDGACAIHDLELEMNMPFSARPSAPYRMDLAITYRCNNDCAHCYNARERNFPELDTEGWFKVLDQLWALGVPHIVFTGGEATLRNDLPKLIRHAESNGQITGLNTNARRLADERYVQQLVDAGLDHVQITVESCDEQIHDQMMRAKGAFKQTIQGLKNALQAKLYVMTNTTMLRTNLHTIPDTLDFLADVGVPTIGLNALIYSGQGLTVGTGLKENELQPILDIATRKTNERGQRLIWYTPTLHRGAVQHVHRIERERPAVPVVLPSARQLPHRLVGFDLESRTIRAIARAAKPARQMRGLSRRYRMRRRLPAHVRDSSKTIWRQSAYRQLAPCH